MLESWPSMTHDVRQVLTHHDWQWRVYRNMAVVTWLSEKVGDQEDQDWCPRSDWSHRLSWIQADRSSSGCCNVVSKDKKYFPLEFWLISLIIISNLVLNIFNNIPGNIMNLNINYQSLKTAVNWSMNNVYCYIYNYIYIHVIYFQLLIQFLLQTVFHLKMMMYLHLIPKWSI